MNIPSSLLMLLLAELAISLTLARPLSGGDWPQAVVLALLIMLLLRALIIAFIWGFSRCYASPAPRLSPLRWAQMLAEEYLAYVFTFTLLLPFERLWMRPDRLRPAREVILLVHGYGCSRGVWWKLRTELEAAGHVVATISLTPPLAGIDTLQAQLATRIAEVCQATGARQLQLVAHSMGGLVSRAYLKRHGTGRIAQLITLATPHRGSQLAHLGLGQNARQMQPQSAWLMALGEDGPDVPLISVRTSHDNFVTPQDNQQLAGARDIALIGTGHLALLYRHKTYLLLEQLLARQARPLAETDIETA
ncbi:esterase/lipase family protein [Craterilacuibacter sp.]|uniref:esterase/lipase family protein n=1 Tax=Craterilacuibacter sp. TaxID=2870909 RepID=UPI003F2FFB9C